MADKNYFLRYGEPALGLLSGALAEPLAGWAGLLSGGDAGKVEATRRALTYQPRTTEGKAGQQAMADAVGTAKRVMVDENPPVRMALDAYGNLSDRAGAVSPLLGAAMQTAPAAVGMLAGPGSSVTRAAISTVGRDAAKGTARAAVQGAENLSRPAVSGLLADQRGAITWHGTPHKFNKFDSSKIGTGEGAQVYGHGLYLAEAPEVAKTYMRSNSANGLVSGVDGMPVDFSGLSPAARRFLQEHTAYGSSPNDIMQTAKVTAAQARGWDAADIRDGMAASRQHYIDAMDEVQKFIPEKQAMVDPGSLYKVDLPDEHIARMIDWDNAVPATQHAPLSKSALNEFGSGLTDTSGEHLYNEVVKQFEWANHPQPKDAATAWLTDRGVPGIRYLDGASRIGGEGTSNYVVFPKNEGLLSILERDGKPLLGGQ